MLRAISGVGMAQHSEPALPVTEAGADLYVAITNHGFGHATRMASVLAELKRRCPGLRLVLATGAPRWLLEAYLPGPFVYRPCKLDVGVVQADSLNMDLVATKAQIEAIRDRQTQIITEESQFIQTQGIRLVFGDIPPLAAPIAKAAGVPCWMMSNFGWNFIYRDWGAEFADICRWIDDCFSQCDRLFRLPFHEPMEAFSHIEDVGLTGGTPSYNSDALRQQLGITAPQDQTVLLTFGGLSLQQIPYDRLSQFPDWQFITFDQKAPDRPNLLIADNDAYRPVDFMPICRCVISKPGYSTFAEACRQDTPIISLTRQGFAEAPILLRELPTWVPHHIVGQEEFFEGDWSFLRQPLQPVIPAEPARSPAAKQGNETIAGAIAEFLTSP